MKRKFFMVLTSVFFMVAVPMAFASEEPAEVAEKETQEEVTFFEVEKADVPAAVSKAAKEDNPGATVEKAEVAYIGGEQVYKITMKNEGEDLIALYKSDGSRYNPQE